MPRRCRWSITPVHPHACGDNASQMNSLAQAIGPPPRVWGQQCLYLTALRMVGPPPRVWGQRWIARSVDQGNGPPPRVWGQLTAIFTRHEPPRSTPTRVGTTHYARPTAPPSQVHPHACGDNGCRDSQQRNGLGPPPRVWGQRLDLREAQFSSLVHPHACGDNPPLTKKLAILAYAPLLHFVQTIHDFLDQLYTLPFHDLARRFPRQAHGKPLLRIG